MEALPLQIAGAATLVPPLTAVAGGTSTSDASFASAFTMALDGVSASNPSGSPVASRPPALPIATADGKLDSTAASVLNCLTASLVPSAPAVETHPVAALSSADGAARQPNPAVVPLACLTSDSKTASALPAIYRELSNRTLSSRTEKVARAIQPATSGDGAPSPRVSKSNRRSSATNPLPTHEAGITNVVSAETSTGVAVSALSLVALPTQDSVARITPTEQPVAKAEFAGDSHQSSASPSSRMIGQVPDLPKAIHLTSATAQTVAPEFAARNDPANPRASSATSLSDSIAESAVATEGVAPPPQATALTTAPLTDNHAEASEGSAGLEKFGNAKTSAHDDSTVESWAGAPIHEPGSAAISDQEAAPQALRIEGTVFQNTEVSKLSVSVPSPTSANAPAGKDATANIVDQGVLPNDLTVPHSTGGKAEHLSVGAGPRRDSDEQPAPAISPAPQVAPTVRFVETPLQDSQRVDSSPPVILDPQLSAPARSSRSEKMEEPGSGQSSVTLGVNSNVGSSHALIADSSTSNQGKSGQQGGRSQAEHTASMAFKPGPSNSSTFSPDLTTNVFAAQPPAVTASHTPAPTLATPTSTKQAASSLSAWQNFDGGTGKLVQSASITQSEGGTEMHVELRSGPLGPMEVHAVVREGSVGAQIHVQGQEAHTLLAAELPSLERALTERNLHVDNLSVYQDQTASGMGSGGQQHSQPESSPTPHRQVPLWNSAAKPADEISYALSGEEMGAPGSRLSVRA